LGLFAAVVSLGKKLYSHCLSHPAVKPGKYCILCVIRAQLKSSFIADVVIRVKNLKKKNKQIIMTATPSFFRVRVGVVKNHLVTIARILAVSQRSSNCYQFSTPTLTRKKPAVFARL